MSPLEFFASQSMVWLGSLLVAKKLAVRDLSGRHVLQRSVLSPSIFSMLTAQITSRGPTPNLSRIFFNPHLLVTSMAILSSHSNKDSQPSDSNLGLGQIDDPNPVASKQARRIYFLLRPMRNYPACGRTGVAPAVHRISVRYLAPWFVGIQWISDQPIPMVCLPAMDLQSPNHPPIKGLDQRWGAPPPSLPCSFSESQSRLDPRRSSTSTQTWPCG